MTKKLVLVIALVFAFAAGAGAAVGAVAVSRAVPWPANCTTNACLNTHLNDLNTRVKSLNRSTFSKRVVVTDEVASDPEHPDFIETMVPCGQPGTDRFRGWAISGGLSIGGSNAHQWQVYASGPPSAMNSWHLAAHNPEYVAGDPLPTVTAFAICLK